MKTDIILAGVGGQGILSIAASIGQAALKNKMYLKQAETHGMSQRGGDVVSHLRISDKPIHSDLIPEGKADLIISVEPMEGLRYVPYLSETGYLITNSTPFVNIPNYPDIDKVMAEIDKLEHKVVLDADAIAKALKSRRSSNMVMLGASSPFLNGVTPQNLQDGIKEIFGKKGEDVVAVNVDAFLAGKAEADKIIG